MMGKMLARVLRSKIFILVLAGLFLRLIFIFSAFHGDLNNNISWGQIASRGGLNGFYGSSDSDDWQFSAPNQPPLTILLFSTAATVWEMLDKAVILLNNNFGIFPSKIVWFWEEKGMELLVKLPSVIFDVGIALLIYVYYLSNNNKKSGLILSGIWLFNPVTWYNSSVWGQTDPIVNFFGLFAVLSLLRRDLPKFGVLFTVSILFKGSLAIFAPVLISIAIFQRYKLRSYLYSLFASLLTIFIVSFWFHPYSDFPVWLLRLYAERIFPGEIGYLSANAFNFWWLVDNGNTYDSHVFFGLTARVWGFVPVILGNIYVIHFILKNKISEKSVFLGLSISSLLAFVFLTRIHERYLYPFFPYATLVLLDIGGLMIVYFVLSLAHLFNLYNLFWVPELPYLKKTMEAGLLPKALSCLIMASLGGMLVSTVNMFRQTGKKSLRQ